MSATRQRRRRFWREDALRALVVTAVCGAAACASLPPPVAQAPRELVLGYDDARPSGSMAFPNETYETVVRFELPDGEHKPLRLRFQAEAAGRVEITIYDSTVFETPGDALRTVTRELSASDVSNGKDGCWVVEDLASMEPLKGVVWVGIHKVGGAPTIWASSVVSGQAFVRNNDPKNPMGLLPTKRTPMIRLELAR